MVPAAASRQHCSSVSVHATKPDKAAAAAGTGYTHTAVRAVLLYRSDNRASVGDRRLTWRRGMWRGLWGSVETV